MSKPRGRCVYCGRFDVTKQHVWPDWLSVVLPTTESSHHHLLMEMTSPAHNVMSLRPRVEVRRGGLGTRKIRNVCAQCNGGWMSRLESAAKSHLTKLILGRPLVLNSDDQRALAAWVTMFCITAEFTDRAHMGIPKGDRLALMESSGPLANWKIFIGRYVGIETTKRYSHIGGELRIIQSTGFLDATVQRTILVAGELLAYAFSATCPLHHVEARFGPEHDVPLKQIWPVVHETLCSESLEEFGDVAWAALVHKAQIALTNGEWGITPAVGSPHGQPGA
jgi:hypothetical protein